MYKLLIVDDEPLVCVGIQSMLDWAALGIEVVGTARNGCQAEEMIARDKPDIVISDIKMPMKNGLQLARESFEKNGRIPVFIMLTSFEEFEFARQALRAQAVDYLIKMELDSERLEAAVKNSIAVVDRNRAAGPGSQQLARSSIQSLREKFFIRLFNDLFESEEMYTAQLSDLDIDLDFDAFTVASCEMRLPEQQAGEADEHLSLYNNAMRLVRETLARHMKCYVVPLDMVHFSVVFCLREQECAEYRPPVRQALLQTAEALLDYIRVQMYSAVGSRVDTPRQLSASYRQAQRCIHGVTADHPIVFYEKTADNSIAYITRVHEIRQGIRKAFEELDTVALNDSLTSIADTVERHPDDLLQAVDAACNILYMAISLLPDGETMLEGIFADTRDGYRSLYHLRDTGSIAEWIRRLRDGCLEQLQSHKHSNKERVVENVKAYIRENPGKRLSLQEVAAVFNFNPNYLSHLFSKYAGVGFVDYITSVRIGAAKEMLAQGELRIYEIAERLGFESSFYFSKVFKKTEGMSPREYMYKLTAFDSDSGEDHSARGNNGANSIEG